MEFGHTLQCCQVVRNRVIAADLMIRNFCMKIGEVGLGLAMHSNLTEPEPMS